jgi:DNA methylase
MGRANPQIAPTPELGEGRRIEYIALDEIVPASRNPRRHGIDGIRSSIGRFGFATPALRDERTGRLVAGHGRTLALAAMREAGENPPAGIRPAPDGRWLVPVICGWASRSDAEADAYLVADNRHTELAGWDDAGLHALLASIGEVDPDLVAIAGYDDADIAALLGGKVTELPPALTDPDDVPEPPADPVSKNGDVWQLGKHRVACGDSTNPETWDRILDGARPALVFTDPPYGIGYQPKAVAGPGRAVSAARKAMATTTIANDASLAEAGQVAQDALALLHDAVAHFVCCDWRPPAGTVQAMQGAAIQPKACIVWDKGGPYQHMDRFAKGHEFIVYAGPYGGQPTRGTDIWAVHREFRPDHPTPKPVELVVRAIEAASQRGDLVADPFGGSGPTVIASQATGRRAAVVELDPRYVDVICRRYEEFTGQVPVLAATGEARSFRELGGDRG